MKDVLKFSALDMRREVRSASQLIDEINSPIEVDSYKAWLIDMLEYFYNQINNVLYYTDLQIDDSELMEAVTTDFITCKNNFGLLSNTYIPLLLRLNANDIPALKFIQWLHSQHPQTSDHPFIIANGEFGIYPSSKSPIRYYLPITSQLSLLYFPLFFHEFGHLLFVKHLDEMVALIKEFQKKLNGMISIPVQQFDSKYVQEVTKKSLIIETWFEWMEELFCDMVGLTIGGASYLQAFSNFLRFQGSSSFMVADKELARRSHPVSWLRVKILAEKATQMGLETEANKMISDWQKIAACLKVKEDHFGYYDPEIHEQMISTLNDMLTEADPIKCADYVKKNDRNYIQLLNEAWLEYEKSESQQTSQTISS